MKELHYGTYDLNRMCDKCTSTATGVRTATASPPISNFYCDAHGKAVGRG